MAGHQSTKASSGGPKIDSLNRQVHRSKGRRPGTMIGTRPLAGAHSGRFPGHRLLLVTPGATVAAGLPITGRKLGRSPFALVRLLRRAATYVDRILSGEKPGRSPGAVSDQ